MNAVVVAYDGCGYCCLWLRLGFGGFYLGVVSGFCVWGFALWGLRVVDYFGLDCGVLCWAVGCTWCGFVLRIVVFWRFGFAGLFGVVLLILLLCSLLCGE